MPSNLIFKLLLITPIISSNLNFCINESRKINTSISFSKTKIELAARKFNPWTYPIFLLKLEYAVNT